MDVRTVAVEQVVDEILEHGAYKATKFIYTEKQVITVKATRKRYKVTAGRRLKAFDIILTIGPPNYEEREQIKRAKKAGQGPVEMTMKYAKSKK